MITLLLTQTKSHYPYPILDNGISSFYHLYNDYSDRHHQHYLSESSSSPSLTDPNYLQNQESCKEHANMNVLENPSYFCYACKRDTLLSVQLGGLADLLRDTEMQRERAEDCIKALKQELEK